MSQQIDTMLLATATAISRDVLLRWAADVDAQGRFPAESIQALRESGLCGYFVPAQLGGLEGNAQTFWRIAAALGEGCLSTALIWAMHCQQVAVLARHARDSHADVLQAVANDGSLVASVTSEKGKGGDLLRAHEPLMPDGDGFQLRRFAPVVSYGAEADYYLITVRSAPERPTTDVALVLARPADGQISVEGDWNAMGMRGTRSIPMLFDLRLPASARLATPFRRIALETMVPVGHLGWAASWFGAARGVLSRFVAQLRDPAQRGDKTWQSDLFVQRLARLRMSLDLVEALLEQTAQRMDRVGLEQTDETSGGIKENIALNNLKIAAAELSFQVVNDLLAISGLSQGYLKDDSIGIERTFRDLRSATLMYHNDRLLQANGKLLFVERTPMQAVWQPGEG